MLQNIAITCVVAGKSIVISRVEHSSSRVVHCERGLMSPEHPARVQCPVHILLDSPLQASWSPAPAWPAPTTRSAAIITDEDGPGTSNAGKVDPHFDTRAVIGPAGGAFVTAFLIG